MARAMYRHKISDIFLLDGLSRPAQHVISMRVCVLADPFSAVDMNVGHHMFESCLKGILKSKTRLLVLSSHLHFLSLVDSIIVVENGCAAPLSCPVASLTDCMCSQISAVGTFDELKDRYAALMASDRCISLSRGTATLLLSLAQRDIGK